ncbi:PEGA domain-containing protein [Verrucomicrobia bacterium]|nr:PEGA domain-containing protein [Verrucomicrobiota bacterium]
MIKKKCNECGTLYPLSYTGACTVDDESDWNTACEKHPALNLGGDSICQMCESEQEIIKLKNKEKRWNARLARARLKLLGRLACFLMVLCVGGYFGYTHLKSLNVLEVTVSTEDGTPINGATIKVNGTVSRSGTIVPAGNLKITISAKGYNEQTLLETLVIGKPLSLGVIKLKRSLGDVHVTSTHDTHWTASFIGESAEEATAISRQAKKDTGTEAIQFETGEWNISASLTNKPINKIWTENITVKVLRNKKTDANISFDAGKFTIISETEGARIFLDKFPIGTNSVSVPNVKPGEYELELKVTDFLTGEIKTKKQKLNVIAGEETKISESFKAASTSITSSPPGAQVIYEDKMLGETPITISTFSTGEYAFLFRYPDKFEEAIGKKDRWVERESSIDMKVGESKSYDENFGLVDLSLFSPLKEAHIKIYDSEKDVFSSLKSSTPLVLNNIKPGQYRIVMETEDVLGSLGNKEKRWWSITNNVTVVSGGNAEVNSDFVGGKVDIESVPPGADVMIGNRMLGKKTPLKMFGVMPSKTDLTLRIKDAFGIKTRTGEWYSKTNRLTVIAGKTAKLNEEFKYGSIKFDSVPKGAEVMCKGVSLGKDPLIENLVPRNYEFDLKYGIMPPQEDYIFSKSFKITVKGGGVMARKIILNSGIDLTTQPAGATIMHKGHQVGVSPMKLPNLFPEGYSFSISMKGYRDVDCRITTSSNKVTRCELPLVPATRNPFRKRQLRTAYAGYLETPEQSEKYIAESLPWIISKRHKRGYWNTKSGFFSDPRNTTVTVLALIGLLNHGYTYDGPEANDAVLTKGVNHILDNAKRTGCLDADNKILGHGMATLLIANLDQDKIQGKVKVALQNALTYSTNQQNDDGSWGEGNEVQYESIFILLSYLAAEDAGIEMEAMKESKARFENMAKNNLKLFNKGLVSLMVLASKKQAGNPNPEEIEKLVNRCLKSISDVGEDGMLADCFILSQISAKLKHKYKIRILRDLTKRFDSLRTDIKSVEESGYWKTSGKWCPSSDDHMFYSNIVPLIVFQSFYQGGDASVPVVFEFNK